MLHGCAHSSNSKNPGNPGGAEGLTPYNGVVEETNEWHAWTLLELFIKIILLTRAQNDPVLTSPARLNVAIITPLGEDLDSTNV